PVAVEERQPRLADSTVRPIAVLGGAEGILVALHDDPVEAGVLRSSRAGLPEPAGLGAAAITADIQGGAGLDRLMPRARRRREGPRGGGEGAAAREEHTMA